MTTHNNFYRRPQLPGPLAAAQACGEDDRSLKLAAAKEFARFNGWQIAGYSFSPAQIGTGQRDGRVSHELSDHPLFFRSGRRNSAIVGQPYVLNRAAADAVADRYGLVWFLPPRPKASIYSSSCFFLVLHERGHAIAWLPEQIK